MVSSVAVDHHDGVLSVRLTRPEKKNALTGEMYAAIADAFDRVKNDPSLNVLTLTGSGDSFTSGNDIADFLSSSDTTGERPVTRFLSALAHFPKPIIVGVNGLAVGIGVTMLLHCDVVLASENASFRLPFVDLGLVPEAASSLLLPRLIGYQRTASLMMCGDTLTADEAKSLGLVRTICRQDELSTELDKLATALARKPPRAIQLTKRLLKGDTTPVADRMKEETSYFQDQLKSAEAREAMLAFREKRAPDFSKLRG
jgi:enoyl-CoA hydratase/carnithine racemase